ncbi:hypothetical protein [Pseudomonas putida]|uniref:hypothetical protein n=1 Tax=Pseudomonas putida TaxID=303 RepID=UPI00236387AC|nr:hypothetical protein [Pseudomonas putida]MDD2104490.1 hypothetical protein [Pseudomonas putida]
MEKEVSVVEALKGFMSEMRDWETAFRDEQMSLIDAEKIPLTVIKSMNSSLRRF